MVGAVTEEVRRTFDIPEENYIKETKKVVSLNKTEKAKGNCLS